MGVVSEQVGAIVLSKPCESLLKLVLAIPNADPLMFIILMIITLLLETPPIHPDRSFRVSVQLVNQTSIFRKWLLEREQLLPIKERDRESD